MTMFQPPAISMFSGGVRRWTLVTVLLGVGAHALATSGVPKIAIPMDANVLAGKGLEVTPPLHERVRPEGLLKTSAARLFEGEFVVDVWQTDDGGTLAVEGQPFDQYVTILNGTAVLTARGGTPQSFSKGDSYVLPKGFVGTWQLSPGYRELLIVETKAYNAGIATYE